MPEFQRDRSGAVIIKYNEKELEEHLGYRLLRLEERVGELERQLKEVVKVILYLKQKVRDEDGEAWGCNRREGV
jgi:chaperonin cofactor prefoldin